MLITIIVTIYSLPFQAHHGLLVLIIINYKLVFSPRHIPYLFIFHNCTKEPVKLHTGIGVQSWWGWGGGPSPPSCGIFAPFPFVS